MKESWERWRFSPVRRGRTGVQAQHFMCHSEKETGGKVKMQGEKEIVKVRLFIH